MTEPKEVDRSPARRVVDGVVGAALEVQDAVDAGLSAARSINERVWDVAGALGIGGLARAPLDVVSGALQETLARLESRGHAGLEDGRQATRDATADTIDALVSYLAKSPQVDALIQTKVREVIESLARSEALTALVRQLVEGRWASWWEARHLRI